LLFLAGPLILIFITSFATRSPYGQIEWVWTFENYSRVLEPIYLEIFLKSLSLALITSVFCFLLGLPVALAIATAPIKMRNFYLILLTIPFLTNLVIRVCALRVLTGSEGLLTQFLTLIKINHDPYSLSQNQTLVVFGMISTYLPFMIFPLYSALEKFNFELLEAAQDLGATYFNALTKIMLPLLKPAISAGLVLVFIPALADFVIPDLLGGARNVLVGNLISDQFLKSRDWPFGSALAIVLMLILSLFTFSISRWGASATKGKQ
jgi:spermidine/putrescine transport system permease protein